MADERSGLGTAGNTKSDAVVPCWRKGVMTLWLIRSGLSRLDQKMQVFLAVEGQEPEPDALGAEKRLG